MVLRDASASKNGIFEHPLPSSFSPSLLICAPLFRPIPKIFCKLIVTSRTFGIFSYIWQNLSFQDKFYTLIENWKCTLSLNIFISGVLFVDKTDKINAWTIENSVFRVSRWCEQAVENEKKQMLVKNWGGIAPTAVGELGFVLSLCPAELGPAYYGQSKGPPRQWV